MSKKYIKIVKLNIKAGLATPAPPVGPALGQHGINIMEFCKAYNKITNDKKGNIIPVKIFIYEDKSFRFEIKTPPTSELIKKIINLSKGSSKPHLDKVGNINHDQLLQIANIKLPDLDVKDINAALNTVIGTAKSMGIVISKE